MKVDLLLREMVDSDLGVVNAARCSFDKESRWVILPGNPEASTIGERVLSDGDVKLIRYLATHNHWTPFAHAQETFQLFLGQRELSHFLINANLNGFEWPKGQSNYGFILRGSLYAWLTNVDCLPVTVACGIRRFLSNKYPESYKAFCQTFVTNYTSQNDIVHIEPQYDECKPITLRLYVPIFVKRQLETHRRNFVMTDIEDFSQNEVSRRYVDAEPQFYTPKNWRHQSLQKKQGSDDDLTISKVDSIMNTHDYQHVIEMARLYYNAVNKRGTAHEQSRMILPLSTYTTFWWTGSLKAWKRVFELRLAPDTQGETRDIVKMMFDAINR